jgi:membrane protease YdiL (CAAX protease family)
VTKPISTARTVWILTRMGGRRFANRLGSLFSRRRPAAAGTRRRSGTPGKPRWGGLLLPLFGLLFLPQAFFFSQQILSRISATLDEPALVAGEADLDLPLEASGKNSGEEAARKLRRAAGLHVEWPEPDDEPRFLARVALVFSILWLAILLTTLGAQNQDLGRVEWGLEWLFTFPARARSIFLAKLLEYALLNAFTWFTAFPLAATLYLNAGRGWGAIPLAAAATICLNLLLAAARLFLETWLRKRLSLARLKNLQALSTLLGMLALYGVLYLGIAGRPPAWFAAAARAAPAIAWLPPALPAYLAARALPPWLPAASLALGTAVVAAGSVLLAARLVRDGLVLSGGGPLQGSRRKRAAAPRDDGPLGIGRKEALLLLRDRSFLVQTLIVPIVIIGFQLIINPAIWGASAVDARHWATFAFGIGAYVLMFSGFSVLTAEGQALWLLYTFPRPLASILREKTVLWASISGVYVGGLLLVALVRGGAGSAGAIPALVSSLAGVVIFAFVAAGLGVLGADPFAQQAHRKVRPGTAYLFMLLASMYALGIYAPSLWQRASLGILCALLAFAIWQKVEDRLPYLLDPTAAPPPRIGLSDGLIAALAFFVIQGLIAFLWAGAAIEPAPAFPGTVLIVSFVASGSIVVLTALYSFWRLGVPDVLSAVGVRRGDGRRLTAGAVGLGVLLGAAAAVFGALYLEAVLRLPFLADLKEELFLVDRSLERSSPWLLLFLAVLAAPLFEEFIFRGLVYRGLRRTFPTGVSALASAGIFAIVHPPPSVIPVFVLGIAAAVAFERTRLLAAPIAAHMTYNAAVVALGLWRAAGP